MAILSISYIDTLTYQSFAIYFLNCLGNMLLLLEKEHSVNYIRYLHILAWKNLNFFWFLFFCCVFFIACFVVISHQIHLHIIYPIITTLISFNIILFINSIYIVSFKKTKRILHTVSFLCVFLITDLLYLLQSSNILGEISIPLVGNDVSMTLLLFILTLFVMGTTRFKK